MRKLASSNANRRVVKRRGTLFHYYMMYLFLSSVLMTTAGLCMHAILKVDRVDTQAGDYLDTLGRCELAFREDASQMAAIAEESKIVFTADDETNCVWTIKEHRLRRETLRGAELQSVQQFVFPAGTTIKLLAQDDFVVCRLTEPSAMPEGYEPSKSQVKLVEIVATRRFAQTLIAPAAAEDKSEPASGAEPINEGDDE